MYYLIFMNRNKFQKIIIYLLLLSPLSLGIVSCSNNNKSKEEIVEDFIPPINSVAALGQLSPAGEIRKLAPPISQFGSSPRINELLVSEGDFVKKGDILATFDNSEKLVADLEKIDNLIKK